MADTLELNLEDPSLADEIPVGEFPKPLPVSGPRLAAEPTTAKTGFETQPIPCLPLQSTDRP